MITKVEMYICDNCDNVGVGSKQPCMQCGETMKRVTFVRDSAQHRADAYWTCKVYGFENFDDATTCSDCGASAANANR